METKQFNNIVVLLYSQMYIQNDMIFLSVYFRKLELDDCK